MAEPTVQVPVSLVKLAVHYLSRGGFRHLAGQLQDALLSQPTPTAERERYSWHASDCRITPCTCSRATPPSIADMVPGTTFERVTRERWTVARGAITGRLIAESDSDICYLDDIDPSTIRDVTPPAVTT